MFAGISEPTSEVLKFWRATKQEEFFFQGTGRNMLDFNNLGENSDWNGEPQDSGPLGVIYYRYLVHGKSLQAYKFDILTFQSVLDVFALRNRLYNIKDMEAANFKTLLGAHIREVRFQHKKAKLELTFSSNFDSGNLLRASKSEQVLMDEYGQEQEIYEIEVTPDTNTVSEDLPENYWFHFRVKGGKQGRVAIFRVINLTNPCSLNASVCFFSKQLDQTETKGWQRISPKDCRYFPADNPPSDVVFQKSTLPIRTGRHCLEFRYEFTCDREDLTFAPEFPYSYEDLQKDSLKWMMKLSGKKGL